MRILLSRNGIRVAAAAAVLAAVPAVTASTTALRDDPRHVDALVEMMEEMAAESRLAAERIRGAYRSELDDAIADRSALIESLDSGHVTLLPHDPLRFNVRVRLAGDSPIAERDLVYQPIYVAARPAAAGALLTVASRVRSGPVEVTSLVRHERYQRMLRRSNPNAMTEVPTHTLGLAFDISVLDTPLETAYEIREVLRAMAAAGDVFVVAETRQLVFHVVPAPERLGFFAAVYEWLMATHARPPQPAVQAAER